MRAKLIRVSDPVQLKVSDFVDFPPSTTPGNVAICISGGGSRSLVAGMGQLRGLATLHNKNSDLISQTRLISTVSGGSWVGAIFVYLPDQYSDATFLGHYASPTTYTVAGISSVADGMIAGHVTHRISPKSLTLQIILLLLLKIPKNHIWKAIIGIHLLRPYHLYKIDPFDRSESKSFFTYDQQSLQQIVNENPDMASIESHLVKHDENSSRRPYLVCNMSMFVNKIEEPFQYLTPVQSTPFYTGVLPTPGEVTTADDQPIGGGGVESFAFNSIPDRIEHDFAVISQPQPFSLADAISTSSAFFASVVQNIGKRWQENFDEFIAELPDDIHDLPTHLGDLLAQDESLLQLIANTKRRQVSADSTDGHRLLQSIKALDEIVPQYQYWSVNSSPTSELAATPFADGGNLENTGVAAALNYQDVERLIAFVNCDTPMVTGEYGVLDENDQMLPGTEIIVDSQLPPLFGYRPYDDKLGYQLYKNSQPAQDRMFKYNQVFPADAFPQLLQGLWQASGKGSNHYGANYKQTLLTLDNSWFGVKGGRQIVILWVYNNFIKSWYDLLSADIQESVFNNQPASYYNFPNYSTNDTQLTPQQVNLLASMTSWNIVEGSPQLFLSMYQDHPSAGS